MGLTYRKPASIIGPDQISIGLLISSRMEYSKEIW